ncbi:MAG: hypothetical protein QM537_03885 [Candidatus Symbiobacter sp.]|nr:hypothetical protein [Candidatus Symbiobacter sp.]
MSHFVKIVSIFAHHAVAWGAKFHHFAKYHQAKFLAATAVAGLVLLGLFIFAPKFNITIDQRQLIQIDTENGKVYAVPIYAKVSFPWIIDRESGDLFENNKYFSNKITISDPKVVASLGKGSFGFAKNKAMQDEFGWKADGVLVFSPTDSGQDISKSEFVFKVNAKINSALKDSLSYLLLMCFILFCTINANKLTGRVNENSSIFLTKKNNLLGLFFLVIFAFEVFFNGWINDDATITLHSVLNFVHGYGPVINIGERVQAFTHPLWFFLISGMWVFTNQLFISVIILSLLSAVGGFYLFQKHLSNNNSSLIIGGVLILCSKFYIEYSTSGLENPMSHLLIIAISILIFSTKFSTNQKYHYFVLLLSLLYLNRSDLILLFLPYGFFITYEYFLRNLRIGSNPYFLIIKPIAYSLLFASPVIVWTVFSIIYYGFPFPNTAYAKILNFVPLSAKIEQGLRYFYDGFIHDSLTIVVIASAVIFGLFINKNTRLIACGIILYCFYVLYIGGDFFRGRFFSAMFIASICIISQIKINDKLVVSIIILAIFFWFKAIYGYYIQKDAQGYSYIWGEHYAHRNHGRSPLQFVINFDKYYNYPWKFESYNNVYVSGNGIGYAALNHGPNIFNIDPLALSDALLSRLPASHEHPFVPGHMLRRIPTGYEESVLKGENRLADPATREFYEKIRIITRGDLWSWQRFRTIIDLNLHPTPAELVEAYKYPKFKRFNDSDVGYIDNSCDACKNSITTAIDGENILELRLQQPIKIEKNLQLSISGAGDFTFEYALTSWGGFPRFINPVSVTKKETGSTSESQYSLSMNDIFVDYIWVKRKSGNGKFTIKAIKFD